MGWIHEFPLDGNFPVWPDRTTLLVTLETVQDMKAWYAQTTSHKRTTTVPMG